jgi:two-component system, OmpR family, phosphate regulon sensor histidine kinase PhoR
MTPFLVRALAALACGLLGAVPALVWGWHPAMVALCAAMGAAAYTADDVLVGSRLMAWVTQGAAGQAPRLKGLWSELAYRMERLLQARAHDARKEQDRNAHLLAALEASPNGVMLLDDKDHIEWCSRQAAAHLGLDPQRDHGQHVTNLVRHPAFVARLAQGDDAAAALVERPGDMTVSAYVRRYGEGSRLVLTQDVTERERTESMRRTFVANVSHEIRTPLTVVAGYVETLRDLPLSDAERGRALHHMHTQTQRMQALVADLLVLAQLEGSDQPNAHDWLPLGALVGDAVNTASSLSAGRHRLEAAIPPGIEVAGSGSELMSALSNLLSNAVRYTPNDGLIDVKAIVQESGTLQIDVRDSGIGIAREHLSRLTERFYRVDQSRSRDTGGTGLGLAIVKHVMQRHGGELLLSSEPGKGSTFSLLLPAARVRSNLLKRT